MSKKIENKIVFISLGLFFLTSTVTGLSIIYPTLEPLDNHHSSGQPANIQTFHQNQKTKYSQLKIIAIPCKPRKNHKIKLAKNIIQIRIKSQYCGVDTENFKWTQVVNSSNKHEATIFETKNNKFSSDFIHLDQGTNVIKVLEYSKNGKRKLSQLTIVK